MKMHFSAKFSSIRRFSAPAGPPVQERGWSASCGKELCAVCVGGLHSLGSPVMPCRYGTLTRLDQNNKMAPSLAVPNPRSLEKSPPTLKCWKNIYLC